MPGMSRLCTRGSGSRLPAVFALFMLGFCRGGQGGIFIVTMHLVNEMPAFVFQIRVFLCKGRDFLNGAGHRVSAGLPAGLGAR